VIATQIYIGAVSVVARLNDIATPWSAYFIGGPAIYSIGGSNSPLLRPEAPSHFGFTGGIGFEMRRSRHVYFVEARYMSMPPGGMVPLVVGMRF
jgi:hypothetical protein